MSETKCKDAIAKAKERLEKERAEEGNTTPVDMTAETEVRARSRRGDPRGGMAPPFASSAVAFAGGFVRAPR